MYSIVLADDEPFIIRGVKKMVDWEKLNIRIVGEAGNGEQLMALIEKQQPDVVLSDIAMPKATGLDVIKEIKARHLDTKVIFMSGYQEFDYAKSAIQYGAVDYLLKPVEPKELEMSIIKALQLLTRDRSGSAAGNGSWESLEEMKHALKTMNSSYESTNVHERFEELGIDMEGKILQGVCFSFDPMREKEMLDKNKMELMKFSVFKRIQGYLKEERLGFAVKRDDNSCNIILILPKADSEAVLQEAIARTRELICREAEIRLNVGVGQPVDDFKNIQLAYKTAKLSSELYYFQQESDIYYNQLQKVFTMSFDDLTAAYKVFLQAVLNWEADYLAHLQECLDIIENLHFGNRYAAENRCVVMAWDLFRDLKEYYLVPEESERQYERWVEALRNQNTFQELRQRFTAYLNKFIADIKAAKGGSEPATIQQVKKYIREHYAETINLQQIARMVYMNPYYFSTFFKKETGQNFKNYVTEIRMQQALKLLMKTEMKTYELAEAVGYKDVRTFTEKFREIYGESPSAYKRKKN